MVKKTHIIDVNGNRSVEDWDKWKKKKEGKYTLLDPFTKKNLDNLTPEEQTVYIFIIKNFGRFKFFSVFKTVTLGSQKISTKKLRTKMLKK